MILFMMYYIYLDLILRMSARINKAGHISTELLIVLMFHYDMVCVQNVNTFSIKRRLSENQYMDK